MARTVKLALNIGSRDAVRLGLAPDKTLAGTAVSVDDKAADEMLSKGWAVENRPGPVKAAPQAGVRADTPFNVPTLDESATQAAYDADFAPEADDEAPDFEGMTKAELKAYADDNDIAGVNMAMSHADMVKAVKGHAK